MSDENQTVVWKAESPPFGETTVDEDPDNDGVTVTLNVRFPGQYYDSETNLHYNWNRYYDPQLGRYITSDPIGLKAGFNTYSYVAQGPLNRFDFNGLESVPSPGIPAPGYGALPEPTPLLPPAPPGFPPVTKCPTPPADYSYVSEEIMFYYGETCWVVIDPDTGEEHTICERSGANNTQPNKCVVACLYKNCDGKPLVLQGTCATPPSAPIGS